MYCYGFPGGTYPSLGQLPGLVGVPRAAPDLRLGTWRRGESGVVQALARLRVDQGPARLRLPHLRPSAVAGVKIDGRAVRCAAADHIQALAERLQRAVWLGCPVLSGRAIAGIDLHGRPV